MKKEYDLSYVIEEFVEKFDQESELNLSEFSKQVLRDAITEWDYIHTPKLKDDDMVNSPAHYMHGGIETIELIKAFLTPEEFRGYLKGNIIKYRDRAPYKGQTEQDYEKAVRYWEWLKGEK
jgi:hypothetical protein